jgi:hypothetical protein
MKGTLARMVRILDCPQPLGQTRVASLCYTSWMRTFGLERPHAAPNNPRGSADSHSNPEPDAHHQLPGSNPGLRADMHSAAQTLLPLDGAG